MYELSLSLVAVQDLTATQDLTAEPYAFDRHGRISSLEGTKSRQPPSPNYFPKSILSSKARRAPHYLWSVVSCSLRHSVVESKFFKAFLDAPGTGDRTSFAGFKYEWKAKVDPSLTSWDSDAPGLKWFLQSLRHYEFPQFETIETELFKPVWVRDTFEKLLRVFYHELYDPLQWEDLELMTEIADYLLALPSLAKGLHMNCIAYPSLSTACQETPESILLVAMKLRNKILFKEGIMCVINPWSREGERIERIENEKVRALAQSTFDGIELKISKALHRILDIVGEKRELEHNGTGRSVNPLSKFGAFLEASHNSGPDHLGRLCLPHLFRLVYSDKEETLLKPWGYSHNWEIRTLLEPNQSRLAFPGQIVGRDEAVLDYFLNVDVDDDDLPWDPAESDW